jgi:hypothetical protein
MINQMENVLTNTTHAVAVGAVSAPLWLPSLTQISNFAALCMPILGALWLLIQITRAVWSKRSN